MTTSVVRPAVTVSLAKLADELSGGAAMAPSTLGPVTSFGGDLGDSNRRWGSDRFSLPPQMKV